MAEARPPDDAQSWSDEEWIAWLESTDGDATAQPEVSAPRKARSVGAQMIGAAMMGFAEIFYGKREEQQVQVAPAPGPPDDQDIEVILDPDDPASSEIRFKNGERD